jgi:hypothetical protein
MAKKYAIILTEKDAKLLTNYLGMASRKSVMDLAKDAKDSYVGLNESFDADYPDYDSREASKLIDRIYGPLRKKLWPEDDKPEVLDFT